MDGLKKRLKESLQAKLAVTLSLLILVAAGAAGIFAFVSAFEEAHEFQDDMLRQISALVERQQLALNPSAARGNARRHDEDARVIVQRLDGADHPLALDGAAGLSLPATLRDGLQTLEVKGDGFRVLIKTTSNGERLAVAQSSAFRNELARDSAVRTVLPFLILVPILLLIVANLVRKMFSPIAALALEVDKRDERELHALAVESVPLEVRPFISAINRMLARVEKAVEAQRRFVADAAHELRSPLTALSLQAERLANADMPAPAQERLKPLRQGIERSRNLLDQLLALARAQSAPGNTAAPLSVTAVYRRVVEDLMPLAQAKDIDIGVQGEGDVEVLANELDIVTVVRNLVDNAIRYTPEGGKVDLSVYAEQGRAVIEVLDSGPGIPPAERAAVLAPFYRTLGTGQIGAGLGLSIVKAIADRLGAEVRLGCAGDGQSGLRISILLPLPRPA